MMCNSPKLIKVVSKKRATFSPTPLITSSGLSPMFSGILAGKAFFLDANFYNSIYTAAIQQGDIFTSKKIRGMRTFFQG